MAKISQALFSPPLKENKAAAQAISQEATEDKSMDQEQDSLVPLVTRGLFHHVDSMNLHLVRPQCLANKGLDWVNL